MRRDELLKSDRLSELLLMISGATIFVLLVMISLATALGTPAPR